MPRTRAINAHERSEFAPSDRLATLHGVPRTASYIMPRATHLTAALLGLSLTACAGLSGSPRPTFDQGALNSTWYGAYHRPLPGSEPRARTPRPAEEAAVASVPVRTPSSDVRIPETSGDGYEPRHAAAYVRDVYGMNDTPIGDAGTRDVVDVYRYVQEHGNIYHSDRPAVGDLVFFHNTFDANSDRRPNDWFTHVGIVESVAADDTVTVLSYADGAIGRIYMNRSDADTERRDGQTINSPLRTQRRDDPAHTEHTAAHLFAGFGALLGDVTQVVVLDQWSPGESPSLQASR